MTGDYLNILAFFAHPDDETMLSGGTLALLSQMGAQVHILIATRGEGGEVGEPPVCDREQLGAYREHELRCAAEALGAASLILFDYADPLVGPDNTLFPFTEDTDRLVAQLIEQIHKTGADALICHGVNGEYGHPAHRLAHQAAARAIAEMGANAPVFYTVMGAFEGCTFPRLLNADAPAHLVIDLSTVLQRKIDAALCHRSQHALFVRAQSKEAGRALSVPEVVLALESLTRVSPPVTTMPPRDPLADLLLASGQVKAT